MGVASSCCALVLARDRARNRHGGRSRDCLGHPKRLRLRVTTPPPRPVAVRRTATRPPKNARLYGRLTRDRSVSDEPAPGSDQPDPPHHAADQQNNIGSDKSLRTSLLPAKRPVPLLWESCRAASSLNRRHQVRGRSANRARSRAIRPCGGGGSSSRKVCTVTDPRGRREFHD